MPAIRPADVPVASPSIHPEDHLKLAKFVAGRWYRHHVGMDFDELFSVACIGLVKAARAYSVARGASWTTYAVRVLDNEIKMELRKNQRHWDFGYGLVYLENPLNSEDDLTAYSLFESQGEDSYEWLCRHAEAAEVLQVIHQLPERCRQVMLLQYRDGLTQHQTSRRLGISQSYVSRLATTGRRQVRQMLGV